MPHIFIILFCMIVLALIATYIVPSGQYDRVVLEGTSRKIVDPTSFHYVEKTYISPFSVLTKILDGMTGAGQVAFMILIIGGSWEVINATGAIASAINGIGNRVKGKETSVFPILMAVFAVIAAIIGGAELQLVYLPAIMPLILALGYDTLTAVACVSIGAYSAFAVSVTNPMTVGIGDQIAGIEMYSGAWYRIILQFVFFAAGVWYVTRYAKKVKANPLSSYVYEESKAFVEGQNVELDNVKVEANKGTKAIGLILVALLALLVVGVMKWDWYMNEINAIFISAAIISAIIGKIDANEACRLFIKGAGGVVGAAFICGLSRTISIILEAGVIIDTIIYALSGIMTVLPKSIALCGMFIIQTLFNFLVNSGSGQFLITMPIMSPIGDIAGLSQNAVILASQMGDGITNMIYPTAGTTMALLGIAKVPYEKWAKFIISYVGLLTGLGCIALIVAQMINYV